MDVKTRLMLAKLGENEAVPIANYTWNNKPNRNDDAYRDSRHMQGVTITDCKIIGSIIWVGYRWKYSQSLGSYIGQYDEKEDRVIPSDGSEYLWSKLDNFIKEGKQSIRQR